MTVQEERPPRLPILRILLSFALAGLLFWGLTNVLEGGLAELMTVSREISWVTVSLGLLTAATLIGLTSWRMKWALQIGGDEVGFWSCVGAIFAAAPVSVITPSRAGDFYRAAHLRHQVPIHRGLSAIVAEKLVDAVVLFFIAGLSALSAEEFLLGALALSCATVGLVVIFVPTVTGLVHRLPLPRTLLGFLDKLMNTSQKLRTHPRLLLNLTLGSASVVLIACVHLWLLLQATGEDTSIGLIVQYWPLSMVAGSLPLTPAGMGSRDAAFIYLLGLDAGSSRILAATLLYTLTAWMYAAVGLLLLLFGVSPPRERASVEKGR